MSSSRKATARSTAVLDAVQSRSVNALRKALASGADPNAADQGGLTPLMETAISGQGAMASVLLDRGADVNARDLGDWAALHYAAQEFRVEIARLLISRGAQIDARDAHGNTPLSTAVLNSKGRGEMIRLLLQSGANKSLKNNHGVSAEDVANTIANYDIAQFLK